jgi:hypothetical protein
VSMLWGAHDHHRDVRALASAPRTTALHYANRENFAVTRHGLTQFPPAAPPLRPTPEFVQSLVSDASKLPLANDSHRQRHQIQRHFGQIASCPTLPTVGRDFVTLSRKQNTHRPSSATTRGFVPRDFRTPSSVRNSSRNRNGGFRVSCRDNHTLTLREPERIDCQSVRLGFC